MKIHLLPDAGMDADRVGRIKELLEETNGAIGFQLHAAVEVSSLWDAATFDELFSVVSAARTSLGLPSNDYLILLTDRPNQRNFFASLDPRQTRNGFVHAGDWNLFLPCDNAVPVAFTVMNLVLLHKTEPDPDGWLKVLHQHPIGCVHDFCGDKRDVIFKLRTGDICNGCIARMRTKGLSDLYIDHAIRILEHLSGKMRHHFAFTPKLALSRMVIDLQAGTLRLTDYDDLMVELDPIDLSYYVLLLFFPDGILNDAWAQDGSVGKVWLASYRVVRSLPKEREVAATIRVQCVNEKERNVRTRRVKEAFEKKLGHNLSKDYVVSVSRGVSRNIPLPRNLVTIRNFESLTDAIRGHEALQEVWRTMSASR